VKLIAQVKLHPLPEQAESLKATMQGFNAACQWLSQRAIELGVFSRSKLQKACYRSIRTLFGLSAQASCLACRKVADAYAVSGIPKTFRSTGAITYDPRLLSWNLPKSTVSIWALPKRLPIAFACNDRQRELLSLPRGQSDLIYRDGNFYLHVSVEARERTTERPADLIGIDLGVANIAFDSDGNSYSGTHLNRVRHRHHALRRKLQQRGTKSAKRLLKKRRRKERRFAANVNHTISKSVVALAERTGRGLALEDLKGIRERTRARKDQRYRLHSWAFAQLTGFIAYKARRSGVFAVSIDPKHTSQECSQCGHTERANRKTQSLFTCRKCSHTEHADKNGARVIRLRGLDALARLPVMQPYAGATGCAN
jgi:putative transposase